MPVAENPFRPGFGLDPAHMGARPDVEGPLLDMLRALQNGEPGAQAAFLYGPRGNGKTVLLHWLARQAAEAAHPVMPVDLLPDHLGNPEGLPGCFRRAAASWRKRQEAPRIACKGNSSGPFASHDPMPALEDWLAGSDTPLLLTLDEAHEARPEAVGRLLRALQIAGEHRPVAVAMAGTPGLTRMLGAAHASFWSRGRKLPVGLLSAEAAEAVVARPFLDAGLDADANAAAELAAAADRYPYFLQLYGEAAWRAVEGTGMGGLLPEHVTLARKAAETPRRLYYTDRYDEFDREASLPVARAVALAFREAGGELSRPALDAVLARETDRVTGMRDFLIDKGFIWRGAEDRAWTPGIPSLIDYMIEETEPEPGLPGRAG